MELLPVNTARTFAAQQRELKRNITVALRKGVPVSVTNSVDVTATDEAVTTKIPAGPLNVTASGESYVPTHGISMGQVALDWDDVTEDVEGADISVTQYEVWGMSGDEDAYHRITLVQDSNAFLRGFDSDADWEFIIRGIAADGTVGEFSEPAAVHFELDNDPPEPPSAPSVYPYLGTLVVGWDGRDYNGQTMVPDFAACGIEISTDSEEWTTVASIYREGTVSVANLVYGAFYHIRLVAYDRTGNASTPSAETIGVPEKIVDGDVDWFSAERIRTGQLQAGVRVIAGPETGNHSELSWEGFTAYAVINGAVYPVIKLGTGATDGLGFTDASGNITASVRADGTANFGDVSVDTLQVGGTDVTLLTDGARGAKGWMQRTTNSTHTATTEVIWFSFNAVLEPNRMYEIAIGPHLVDVDDTSAVASFKLHVAYDGSAATTSSAVVPAAEVRSRPGSTAVSDSPYFRAFLNTSGQNEPQRLANFAYGVYRYSGAGNVWGSASSTNPCIVTIQDVGSSISQTSTLVRRTSAWLCTGMYQHGDITNGLVTSGSLGSSRIYTSGGTGVIPYGKPGYLTDTTTVTGTPGYFWTTCLFGSTAVEGETSLTLPEAMSGATIVSAGIYLYLGSTWATSGTANVTVRPHSLTSDSIAVPSGSSIRPSIKAASGKWNDMTGYWGAGHRGVWVGNYSGDALLDAYSTLLNTTSHPVKLKITYDR